MLNVLATRRLSTHFALAVGIALCGLGAFAAIALDALGGITDLPAARTLISSGLAQYDWALRNQGVYVRRDGGDWESIELAGRYSDRTTATETLPTGEHKPYTFLRKSPTGAVAELAGEISKHDPSRTLRVISTSTSTDIDSTQHPDRFEVDAIEQLTQTGGIEFSAVDVQTRSHRVIRLISAPGHAPLYLSASVPHTSPDLLWTLLPRSVWLAFAAVAALFAILFWAGHHFVVQRVQQLTAFAQALAAAEHEVSIDPPQFHDDEGSSDNEVHRLSFALKALYESTMAALRLLNPRGAP
jgi:hypothetical protein